MSTRITAVPSSIAKFNEIMMDLFDFKSDLHGEKLLNSMFYSDNMAEDNDEYSNEYFSNDDDESIKTYSIDDLDSSDESFNVFRMNYKIINNSIANKLEEFDNESLNLEGFSYENLTFSGISWDEENDGWPYSLFYS